jgi:hypothetical protein
MKESGTQLEPAPYGTPDAYRQVIQEALWRIRVQAQLGDLYVAAGDDAGLVYAMRQLVAYVRLAMSTLGDLQEMKAARRRG